MLVHAAIFLAAHIIWWLAGTMGLDHSMYIMVSEPDYQFPCLIYILQSRHARLIPL